MNNNKTVIIKHRIISIIQLVLGIPFSFILTPFILVGLFSLITDPYDITLQAVAIGIFTVLFLLSVVSVWKGLKTTILLDTYKKYANVLSDDTTGSISNLANVTKMNDITVMKNLSEMIRRNFFNYAHINERNGVIIFSNATGEQLNAQIDYQTFTCSGCGGESNIEMGQRPICEYCGDSLNS